ncbi:MAG: hypothetical protein OEQ13_00150 [Acidobacteriota bacterium]|nr:hypothetical protein [Acidobacteriota bacterium]
MIGSGLALVASFLVVWPAGAQTVRQLTDLKTTFSPPSAIDDAGTVVYSASSTNQLGGNPQHSFQIFSFDAVTGSGQQISSFDGGVAPTTNDTGLLSNLSTSDDGQWLAFVSSADPLGANHDRSPELFVMMSDGTQLAQLTNDAAPNAGSASQIDVSGSATRLVFVSNSDPLGTNPGGHEQLFVVERDGTGLSQLTTSTGGEFIGLTISDDGTRIAFGHDGDLLPGGSPENSDLNAEVFAIQSDGTNLRQLSDDPVYESVRPDISGDGSTIVFQSDANLTSGNNQHQVEIFAIDWSGANLDKVTRTRPFLGADGFSLRPSVTDDGQTIIFLSNHSTNNLNSDGNFDIYKVQRDGTGLTELSNSTATNGCFIPVVSGDGSRVVFLSFDDLVPGGNTDGSLELFAIDGSGGGVVQLTSGTFGSQHQPDVTPDGTRVAFAFDSDPIGDQLMFGGEIFVVESDGTGLTQVTNLVLGRALTPSISADGSRIAFVAETNSLGTNLDRTENAFVIQADGTGLVQLSFTSTGFSAGNTVITPDGAQIFYDADSDDLGTNGDNSREVWRALPGGTGVTQLTSGPAGTSSRRPRADDAGTWVVFESNADLDGSNADGTFEIWRVDSSGSNLSSLTADGSLDSLFPDVSGDGSKVVYSSASDPLGTNPEHNLEIFLYEPATTTRTQVTQTTTGTSSDPRISGNGRYVYFTTDAPIFEIDPDRPVHLARADLQLAIIERVGALQRGRPTVAVPDESGDVAVFSGLGDFTGGNPDTQNEVWIIDRADAGFLVTPSGAAPTSLSWAVASGPLRYDVVRGDVGSLTSGVGGSVDLGTVLCIENDSPDADTSGHEDLSDPAAGQAFFYVARGSAGLLAGPGSYGTGSDGAERQATGGDCAP